MGTKSGIRGISSRDNLPDVLYELLFPASAKTSAQKCAGTPVMGNSIPVQV